MRVKRQLDIIQPNHSEREEPLLSALSVLGEWGNPFPTACSRWAVGRRATCWHTSLPTKGPRCLRDDSEERRFVLRFQVILGTFWSKVRWLFLCCSFFFLFLFFFPFSQGFPKWMAVKDFNILQAQQLILKSLAEGFYRGKLGCKSFWRLFPFWNL